MRSIWTYQTLANGLLSNGVIALVPGKGEDLYVATTGGISGSDTLGEWWNPAVLRQSNNFDICVNQASGVLVFTTVDCTGLGVQRSFGGEVHFLTRERDGLASDCIRSVNIDQAAAVAANDELGPVVISHYDGSGVGDRLARTLSVYKVETGKWRMVELADGFNILRVRFFSGKIYACTEGGLAISADGGEHWSYIDRFSAPPRLPWAGQAASGARVNDIHIGVDGTWYILCQSTVSSWLLKSSDGGRTCEILLSNLQDAYQTIEASRDDLFVLSYSRLTVFNTRESSVKIFRDANGLKVGASVDSNHRFTVHDGRVFIPTDVGVAVAAAADIASYPPLWQYATTARGLPDNAVLCVAGSPSKPGVPVLAGTPSGLAASIDGGQSWAGLDRLGSTLLGRTRINDLFYCSTPTTPFYGIAADNGFFFCSNPLLPGVSAAHYTTRDGLASNRVVCVFARMYTSMQAWVGHDGEGLSYCLDGKWHIANKDSGLAGNHVLSIRPGWYKEKPRLYACGYDKDPFTGEESAALSFSEDNGKTWVAVRRLSWPVGVPYRLFDVCSVDYSSDVLYGLICNKAAHDIWFAKSVDGGASWDTAGAFMLDIYKQSAGSAPDSSPKIYSDTRGQFISLPNSIYFPVPAQNFLQCVYWQDGLRQGNVGSTFIDADGNIYRGNGSSGVGLSNVAYMPFYYWAGQPEG